MPAQRDTTAGQAHETLRRNYELVLSELGEGPNSAFTLETGIRELARRANQADLRREMADEIARLDLVLEAERLRDEIVEAWHAGAFGDRELRDVLGLDEEEFSTWVSRGPHALEKARLRHGERQAGEDAVEKVATRLASLADLDGSETTVNYLLGEIHELAKELRDRRP